MRIIPDVAVRHQPAFRSNNVAELAKAGPGTLCWGDSHVMITTRAGIRIGHTPLVLLVDDHPDTLEMYALGLKCEGFAVEKASDGEPRAT